MIGSLFAADPTWTDKEVITAGVTLAVGIIGAAATISGVVIRFLTTAAREKARQAIAEVADLRSKLARIGDPEYVRSLETRLAASEGERDVARDRATRAEQDVENLRKEAEGYKLVEEGLRGERDNLKKDHDEARKELESEQRRILKAMERGGLTWVDRVLQRQMVEFRRLENGGRTTPIISLLNLKGGVGKTTATANLGAAMAHLGYRVLLIDLDLQGSLTNLFLADEEQDQFQQQHLLLEDFLFSSFDREFPNLLNYIRPTTQLGNGCGIVPTTDTLAYAEMNLTVRWFLRDPNGRDPRLLLRRELQLKRITDEYDIILLDCPPLINISCVNALAASDYVLIPVMPSRQATDRVSILLKRLRDFHANLNPDLKVMGAFANRTFGSELTSEEQSRLELLQENCRGVWGDSVRMFNTFIRQYAAIRDAEDERRPLERDEPMFEVFLSLAREVESYLPGFCRRNERGAT
jgi:chromosome partitioning protein